MTVRDKPKRRDREPFSLKSSCSRERRQEKSMQKNFILTLFVISSLGLAGCGYTPEQRGASGAALGGATGAAIGAATGGGVGAALAGGALGAATGAIVGATTAPPPPPPPPPGYYPPPAPPPARCARYGYDAYGNQVCTQYYGY
jgi:hypothetical protein